MVCPNCHSQIPWYKVALITRWTNLRCQTCQQEWNRNLDLQIWLILLVGASGIALPCLWIVHKHFGDPLWLLLGALLWLLLSCVWLPCITYLDAKTVKLVPPVTKRAA